MVVRALDVQPDWFAINLAGVDRIVSESQPVNQGGGWFGMDDLTYEAVPEPHQAMLVTLGLFGFAARRRRQV